jgi:hypothetical protein
MVVTAGWAFSAAGFSEVMLESIEAVWEVLVRLGRGECGGEVGLLVDIFWESAVKGCGLI